MSSLYDLCRSPDTPVETLRDLARERRLDPHCRALLAANPTVPEPELLELGATIPEALLSNPIWPLWMIADPGILDRLPLRTAVALARCAKTPPDIIRRLAGSNSRPLQVRVAAAGNPFTPRELLDELKSQARDVRAAVARNPRLPPEWQGGLAKDVHAPVRGAIAARRDADPKVLARLAHDRSTQHVRVDVAGNPRTPPEALASLSSSQCTAVQLALASNPSSPPGVRAVARQRSTAGIPF